MGRDRRDDPEPAAHTARAATVNQAGEQLQRLLAVMARLRDPLHGCPWDLEQTFASIVPYTIEEAYEVADAVAQGSPAALRDELGDLLFQVVFQARLAQERGWFDFAAVIGAIHDKLVRRHPHVFAGVALAREELARSWEAHKARERAAADGEAQAGALSGVPRSLPALLRATKLSGRAARVGFDWTLAAQVRAKVLEELGEVDAAVLAAGDGTGSDDAVSEELGDLLFAVVNWCRHLAVEPEGALRAANDKFERRFARMESLARDRGEVLAQLSPQAWDTLWNEAKLNGG
ncbi:MAG: nucleoside triphosphate pyrophosphohydrolase [Proteobacteria bacterium]|nr:nucleoside triphosphate pyrophosphohydrolase [Pseudomonadota bacterium]